MKKLNTLILIIAGILLSTSAVFAAQGELTLTLLNQNPSPAQAGNLLGVRFQLENAGDTPVAGVVVQVVETYPFTIADGKGTVTVGSISNAQTGQNFITVPFNLKVDKDAVAGTYNLKLRYITSTGAATDADIPIIIAGSNFAQIVIDTSRLEPGQETPVTFHITNTGKSALQNVAFSWSEPNGAILPVYSDNTKYIKYLDVGQTADLTYTMVADVNAKAGLYMINLNLQYQNADTSAQTTISTKSGMSVGGTTDFDVAFSETTNGQTALSVANIGNNPALSVSVRVPNQPGYRVSGSSNAIIGNLDRGDYTIVSFQIVQSNGTGNFTGSGTGRNRNFTGNVTGTGQGRNFSGMNFGQDNGLQVMVDYTDTTGVRQSVAKTVPIQFRAGGAGTSGATGTRSATGSSSSVFTDPVYLIGALIVVVGGIWYWNSRKKVNKKQ